MKVTIRKIESDDYEATRDFTAPGDLPLDSLGTAGRLMVLADVAFQEETVTVDVHIKYGDEGVSLEVIDDAGEVVASTYALYSEILIEEDE